MLQAPFTDGRRRRHDPPVGGRRHELVEAAEEGPRGFLIREKVPGYVTQICGSYVQISSSCFWAVAPVFRPSDASQ
jgi:hypothetical protein